MSRIADALTKAGRAPEGATVDGSVEQGIGAFAGGAAPTDIRARSAAAHPPAPAEREPRLHEVRQPVRQSKVVDHLRANECCVLHPGLNGAIVQQYRKVAGTLHQLQVDRSLRTILVTSAVPAEGKTLTAANLALTLSESFKRRVLLVDADLRKPMMATFFGVRETPGLSTILVGHAELGTLIVPVTERLSLMTGGRAEMDPVGSLTSPRMHGLLEQVAADFDWVLIDTPPAALVPDASLLSSLVDGVVFVVRSKTTPSATIQRAIAGIVPDRLIGVILNQAETSSLHEYGYYERYGASYGHGHGFDREVPPGRTTPSQD